MEKESARTEKESARTEKESARTEKESPHSEEGTRKFQVAQPHCHAERNEKSLPASWQTLRFAQGDSVPSALSQGFRCRVSGFRSSALGSLARAKTVKWPRTLSKTCFRIGHFSLTVETCNHTTYFLRLCGFAALRELARLSNWVETCLMPRIII